MSFRDFFFGLTVAERDKFAARCISTRGMLTQVAYGNKLIELGFADVLVKIGAGAFTLDHLPLTENAQRQRRIREGKKVAARAA
jgi:hypothetical protein